MPELPEVEVVKRGLERSLIQPPPSVVRIERFEFLRRDLRYAIPVAKFKKLLGARLLKIARRAKYLIFTTDKGDFLSHLGMTGSWRKLALQQTERPHDHIKMHFLIDDAKEVWVYNDPRRFGIFDFLDQECLGQRLGHLGPEPLLEDFTAEVLWRSFRRRSSSVKAAIMDQKIVVGVGNIYASEALFLAGIRPSVKAEKISRTQAEKLVAAIKSVLSQAIEAGGSTISDFKSADDQSGYFQTQHQVYDRAGELCRVCQTRIKVAVTAGRSTYWCPRCQH
jgi:formamidopyrimidine-DNA glycosylase